jgi:hypothetical protein
MRSSEEYQYPHAQLHIVGLEDHSHSFALETYVASMPQVTHNSVI